MSKRLPFKSKRTVVCRVCGETRTMYDNPNQSFKYCSRECYDESRGAVKGGVVDIVCEYCGKVKSVLHKEVLNGKHRFCSQRCAAVGLDRIPPQTRGKRYNYSGINFRSKGEIKYAEWCDVIGLKWEYEPSIFKLSTSKYIPDFYLPDIDKWIEIKCDVNDKKYKTSEFALTHSLEVLFRKDLNRIRGGLVYEWKN